MAEKAQSHEISRSKRIDIYILFNKLSSTGLAFLLIAGICTAGVWLIYKDKEIGGLGALIAAAGTMIGAFYNSRKKKG